MSWEVSTTPVNVTGSKPTASLTIDSTKVDASKLAALEKILYGSEEADARLPLPDEIAKLMGDTQALSSDASDAQVLSSDASDAQEVTY